MKIFHSISLKSHNTFGLDYTANCFVTIGSENEATSLFSEGHTLPVPFLILGKGSNILFTSNFSGTVLQTDIQGIRVEEQDNESVIVSAGAGVDWDNLVEWTVGKEYYGLENLSLIPGSAGAAPVQNIGAYGVEVKDLITGVNAISIKDGSKKVFNNKECRFEYRNSIFKNEEKGKYLVTRVFFRLKKFPSLNLEYGSLKDELKKWGEPSLFNVRNAVIDIRRRKLPDPAGLGNAGSFFRNPVVALSVAANLKQYNPSMPVYDDPSGGKKIPAGWLIEQCGWKGRRIGNAGVYAKQALVLINYGKASGMDIYKLSERIRDTVKEKFGIILEREVEIVGLT